MHLAANCIQKMLKKTFSLLALLFAFNHVHAQPDSVRRFVDSALNLMQQKSMFSKNVNWKLVRDSAALLSMNASNYSETSRALLFAFNKLGDKHGWLVIDDKEYRNATLQPKENRVSKNMADAAAKGAKIYCGVISGKYAYLSMPFFGGQDTSSMNKFAQRLQDSLCSVVGTGTKGVILDLRLNAGGNSFPMIVCVNNLYGRPQKRRRERILC